MIKPPVNVGRDVPGYTGPADGLSRQKYRWLTGPLNKSLVAGCFRLQVDGMEHVPESGAHVYCPAHPSMFDPPLVMALTDRDIRFIANVRVFDGVRGKLMTWGGAFPVDRERPSVRSIRHCLQVLRDGKGLCIFPEGMVDPQHEFGRIGAFKRGPAWCGLRGGADSLVPIAINYEPNRQAHPTERKVTLAAATAIAAAGTLAGVVGGPVARMVAGAVTGAVAGACAGGTVAHDHTPNPDYWDQFPKYFATLTWGAVGAVVGALTGGLAAAFGGASATVATSLAGAVGTYGIGRGWQNRDVAHVLIGQPLKVADYQARFDQDPQSAVIALTNDLHQAMGEAKATLSGVPYDPTAPRIKYHIVETLKSHVDKH